MPRARRGSRLNPILIEAPDADHLIRDAARRRDARAARRRQRVEDRLVTDDEFATLDDDEQVGLIVRTLGNMERKLARYDAQNKALDRALTRLERSYERVERAMDGLEEGMNRCVSRFDSDMFNNNALVNNRQIYHACTLSGLPERGLLSPFKNPLTGQLIPREVRDRQYVRVGRFPATIRQAEEMQSPAVEWLKKALDCSRTRSRDERDSRRILLDVIGLQEMVIYARWRQD